MGKNEAQIDKYLNGGMTPAEQEAFEAAFQADPALEAELRSYLLAKGSIWEAGIAAEKAKLDALFDQAAHETEPDAASSNRFRPRTWLSIAAAIVLLMAAGYFILNQKASPEELYATYYVTPSAPEEMGAPGIDSLLHLAHGFFNQQQYAEAIELYTTVTQLNGRAESWQYLAYSHMAQGNHQEAIKAFLSDTQPNDMSEWYLALAYLKSNRKKEAKSLLKQIAKDDGHDYQEEAEEAIGKLAN